MESLAWPRLPMAQYQQLHPHLLHEQQRNFFHIYIRLRYKNPATPTRNPPTPPMMLNSFTAAKVLSIVQWGMSPVGWLFGSVLFSGHAQWAAKPWYA